MCVCVLAYAPVSLMILLRFSFLLRGSVDDWEGGGAYPRSTSLMDDDPSDPAVAPQSRPLPRSDPVAPQSRPLPRSDPAPQPRTLPCLVGVSVLNTQTKQSWNKKRRKWQIYIHT